jgi:hypothetical protein
MDDFLRTQSEALTDGLSTLLDVEAGLADVFVERDFAAARDDLVARLDTERGLAAVLPGPAPRPATRVTRNWRQLILDAIVKFGPRRRCETAVVLAAQPAEIRVQLRNELSVQALHLSLLLGVEARMPGRKMARSRELANALVAQAARRWRVPRREDLLAGLLSVVVAGAGKDDEFLPEFLAKVYDTRGMPVTRDTRRASCYAAIAHHISGTRPLSNAAAYDLGFTTLSLLAGQLSVLLVALYIQDLSQDGLRPLSRKVSKVLTALKAAIERDAATRHPLEEVDALEAALDRARNDFVGADLRQASARMPNLGGVRWSRQTRWPAGWEEDILKNSVEIGDGLFEIRQGTAGVAVGA